MDDLYAKFLPQFIRLARQRLALAISAAEQRDDASLTTIKNELHTLAGEAGLLGMKDVVALARDSELKAKQLHISRADADADELVAALRQLGEVIEGFDKAPNA